MRGTPTPARADRHTNPGATRIDTGRKAGLDRRETSSRALPKPRARNCAGAAYVER